MGELGLNIPPMEKYSLQNSNKIKIKKLCILELNKLGWVQNKILTTIPLGNIKVNYGNGIANITSKRVLHKSAFSKILE